MRTAANLALDRKAEDIVIMDLRQFSLNCDYFLIVSGTSEPHVRAIAEWVEEELHTRFGEAVWHREGVTTARWVLLDYVDVVLHIFRADVRETYMLERLWGDAPMERLAADGPADASASSTPAGGDPTGAGDGA